MIGENKYNGLVHRFVSEPIINELWSALSNDSAGSGTGVTLGTDNWFVDADADVLYQRPLYNRLGGGEPADMTNYFYAQDQVYINDLTVYCNFADGLVRQSDLQVLPNTAPVADTAFPDYRIQNNLRVQLLAYYVDKDNKTQVSGSAIFPVTHFNSCIDLGVFMPYNLSDYLTTNKAIWFEVKILSGAESEYSTKSISTTFQSDRALVWAEATLSHTFANADYDAVVAGTSQTGWPT